MFSTHTVGGKKVLEKVRQQEAESSQAEPGTDSGFTPTKWHFHKLKRVIKITRQVYIKAPLCVLFLI